MRVKLGIAALALGMAGALSACGQSVSPTGVPPARVIVPPGQPSPGDVKASTDTNICRETIGQKFNTSNTSVQSVDDPENGQPLTCHGTADGKPITLVVGL